MPADRIVWLDCEMTGLDINRDEIVEIACIVTEADLTEIDTGVSFVVKPEPASLEGMDPVVVEMHTTSGLLDEIPNGIPLRQAEEAVLNYIKQHIPEARKAPLAGSSVYVDRAFLAKYMPDIDTYLHYRLIDVSSVKEIVRRWYPRVYFATPEKTGNHRALADTRESIAELRYYRDATFVPMPGPDSQTARELGGNHVVDHDE